MDGFLTNDDHILIMDMPPEHPRFEHRGDRRFRGVEFRQLADAGIRTIVHYTNWACIERQFGKRDWSYLDETVDEAVEAGLKVLLSDNMVGLKCAPPEWYIATRDPDPVEDQMYGQLSMFSADAQAYNDDFVRALGTRYVNNKVNLFCTFAEYGESFIIGERPNAFYDPAAVASYREFMGNPTVIPTPFNHNNSDQPTEYWLERKIIDVAVHKQSLVMQINGNSEIWTAAHYLWSFQGEGSGAKYYRSVLDAYLTAFPDCSLKGIQFTHWVHLKSFGYGTRFNDDVKRYGIEYYVGAEYAEGLPVYTDDLMGSLARGFICAPKSILTEHDKLEPWMLENIRNANERIRSKYAETVQ